MQSDEPVRRPAEIEEITNLLLIHPLAGRLTPRLADLHVSPNAVSVTGMVFGLLAGLAYYHYQDVRYAVAGFLLMIAWHVMDGADGQLARLTHSQSQTGKVLDGICDYGTWIAVYTALALALGRTWGEGAWALALVAGLCHVAQAAAYEVQREEYNFFGFGRQSADFLAPGALPRLGPGAAPVQRALGALYRLYIRLQLALTGGSAPFRRRLATLLEREPGRAASIRQRYRETFAPVVRRWALLSSNYRTIGIFITALLAAPQLYFEFEILALSAILAVLSFRQHGRYARFVRSLDAAG